MADLPVRFDTQQTRVLFFTGLNRRIIADSSDSLAGRDFSEVVIGIPVRLPDGLVTGNINVGDTQPWIYVARPGGALRNIGILVRKRRNPSAFARRFMHRCSGNSRSRVHRRCALGAARAAHRRSVSSPLRRLDKAANAIAQGDYDQAVPVQGPTEVCELAENFNLMAEQVRASQQSQRDLLANVSHELKTPLTSIQGFAQAISDGAAGDAESIRHSASVIQDEAQRMARMVSELLDLARIESGQIVMRREPVQLGAVLRDGAAKLALRAQQAGVKLNVQVSDDLPVIIGDGDRLAQVFTNLLDNALKHTPEGGQVTLAARHLSGSSIVRRGKTWPAGVEVQVADTGGGIPPEDLGAHLERFYQVDKSRQRGGGLGLGLAIVKQIVEAHYGAIKAESVVGIGSRFVVTLPLDPGTDTTQALRKK